MNDLLMIVPSRGRPENIAGLLEVWFRTIKPAPYPLPTEILVALDDDDPDLDGYQHVIGPFQPSVMVAIGPRKRLGPTLNRLAVEHAGDYFAVGFMGDDHRPRTPDWDERMVAELRAMGTGIVYGNDLVQREALPTAVVMTSDIIRTLGYMVPPGLVHLFMDNFWLGLGQALGRLRYLDDVVIEHCHPLAKTAEWDAGYRECNSREMYARDHAEFVRWVREDSQEAVARLRSLIATGARA